MDKIKRFFKGIWQVISVILAIILWVTWDVWRRRRYKEKVDEIHRDTEVVVQDIKKDVELGDGASLYQRAKKRLGS